MTAARTGLVRDLVGFLSRDRLTVGDVAAFVGPVTADPGAPLPIELRPGLPGVRSARLARYPDSGLPYLLTLEFTADSQPTATELRAVLGDYSRALTGRGMPPELVFSPPGAAEHWQIAVIVQLGSADLDTGPITSLTFRRDPTGR